MTHRKIEVIYNGINTGSQLAQDQYPPDAGKPIVGIVANLNRPVKRVQDFVLAAARVHCAMPNTRFVVVGDGWLRLYLEDLSRSLGLGAALTFMGLVKSPMEIIDRFSVGVITSETEGFCNAMLEYMAWVYRLSQLPPVEIWNWCTRAKMVPFSCRSGDIDMLARSNSSFCFTTMIDVQKWAN